MNYFCNGLHIVCIKEQHIDQNCYLICCGADAVVIDPSYEPRILEALEQIAPQEILILLTHEHYDHIAGVNQLRQRWNCRVVCSQICSGLIRSPKTNKARFYDRLFIFRPIEERRRIHKIIDPQYVCYADQTFQNRLVLKFHELEIHMQTVDVHSPGSVVITIDHSLTFTGDGWLGDVIEHAGRKILPDAQYRVNRIVFPGHGLPMIPECNEEKNES